jgi:uncharacterized protein YjiS (DUF1127 family)
MEMSRSPNSCTTTVAAESRAALPAPARRIVEVCGGLRAALRRRRRRRADLDVLLQMNHRLLADIGLRRTDLDAIMAGVVPIEQIGSPEDEPVPVRPRAGLVVLPGGGGAHRRPGDLDAAA